MKSLVLANPKHQAAFIRGDVVVEAAVPLSADGSLRPGELYESTGGADVYFYLPTYTCLLYTSPGVNFLLLFALGGIWGVAAGLGRIWSPDRLPRLIGVALICGSILGAAYLAAQLLGAGNLLGSTQFGPPPALLTFAAGMLLPLSVLLAKWMSHAVGHRSLR